MITRFFSCRLIISDRSRERGAAMMEFAITIPLLALLVGGMIDISTFFQRQQVVYDAARQGARAAAMAAAQDPSIGCVPLGGALMPPPGADSASSIISGPQVKFRAFPFSTLRECNQINTPDPINLGEVAKKAVCDHLSGAGLDPTAWEISPEFLNGASYIDAGYTLGLTRLRMMRVTVKNTTPSCLMCNLNFLKNIRVQGVSTFVLPTDSGALANPPTITCYDATL